MAQCSKSKQENSGGTMVRIITLLMISVMGMVAGIVVGHAAIGYVHTSDGGNPARLQDQWS